MVEKKERGAAGKPKRQKLRVPHHVRRQQSIAAVRSEAERLFVEHGYHRTTVEDIAKAAGLTKGAVYFHFADKKAVLLSLLEEADQQVMGPILEKLRAPGRRPIDKLVEYMHDWARAALKQRNTMFLPILMSFEFLDTDDEILQQINGSYDRAYEALAAVIEEGQSLGEINVRTSPREQAAVLVALADGALLEWLRRGDKLDGLRFTQAIRDTLQLGVSSRHATAFSSARKTG